MSTFSISKATLNRRRVLFVDDEPFALEVLQRVFEPMQNEWHMEFMTTPQSALERLGQLHFDAVVSDLKMPGMSGAEFLAQVQRQHPGVSRIILSDQADEDLIYQSVNTAHQFISKKSDPKALVKKLRKLILLRGAKFTPEIVEMICALERLPSVPQVYCELVEALASRDSDLRDTSDIVAKDAAMAAKVLQLANSAFFGLRGEVGSIYDACSFLGVETVRYLVLMVGVCEQFKTTRFLPGFVDSIWNHCVLTANIARIIAETEHTSLAMAEQAYVAGLLHDIGKLVFAENLSKSYREVIDFSKLHDQPGWQVERQILKATHADVGAYLLELWGLPESVTEAVRLHHQPSALNEALTPLGIVHVANNLAHEIGDAQQTRPSDLNFEYLQTTGLADRLPIWREVIEQTHQQAAAAA